MRDTGEFEIMPKKEALLISRELVKLEKNLSGIRNMSKRPTIVFILDTVKEHIAVTESNKLGLTVVAVVDTNVNPDIIAFPIPGNDDAIRANELMCREFARPSPKVASSPRRQTRAHRARHQRQPLRVTPKSNLRSTPRKKTLAVKQPSRSFNAMPRLLRPPQS